jgi:hypothetical protein
MQETFETRTLEGGSGPTFLSALLSPCVRASTHELMIASDILFESKEIVSVNGKSNGA